MLFKDFDSKTAQHFWVVDHEGITFQCRMFSKADEENDLWVTQDRGLDFIYRKSELFSSRK